MISEAASQPRTSEVAVIRRQVAAHISQTERTIMLSCFWQRVQEIAAAGRAWELSAAPSMARGHVTPHFWRRKVHLAEGWSRVGKLPGSAA